VKLLRHIFALAPLLGKGELEALAGSHVTDSVLPFLAWRLRLSDPIAHTAAVDMAKALIEALGQGGHRGGALLLLHARAAELVAAQPSTPAFAAAAKALGDLASLSKTKFF
jgi:hypothetical protein